MKPVGRAAEESGTGRQEIERAEIARIVAGETDRFEYFVRTYQKKIFRLAFTLLRDAAEADGLTQDVFVKAYRGLGSFKGDAAFETWLTRITINAVRDVVRRRQPVVSFGDLRRAGRRTGPRFRPISILRTEPLPSAISSRARSASGLPTPSSRFRPGNAPSS